METKIVVRRFPDRKKPCLTVEQGNCCTVIATFRNDHYAKLFENVIGGTLIAEYDVDLFGKEWKRGDE